MAGNLLAEDQSKFKSEYEAARKAFQSRKWADVASPRPGPAQTYMSIFRYNGLVQVQINFATDEELEKYPEPSICIWIGTKFTESN